MTPAVRVDVAAAMERLAEVVSPGPPDSGLPTAEQLQATAWALAEWASLLRSAGAEPDRALYRRSLEECTIIVSRDGTPGTGYAEVPLALWDEIRDRLKGYGYASPQERT